MNKLAFLFAAYLLIWVALAIYLFSLHRRQKALQDEVRALRSLLEKKS